MATIRGARQTGNKYKRAFSFRVDEAGTASSAAHGTVRLSGGDYPDILEDYLTVSRRRQHNATAMANLQIHLLHDAGIQEKSVKHYKAQVPKQASHQEFIDSQIFTHRMIGHAMRVIGDGIAWRAFGFDRSVPRVMSQNATKQVILADGLAAEMEVWSNEFFRAGLFPIFNSITNCLAMGDITVVSDDGAIEIIEVKTNKTKSGRKIRQKDRLKNAVELLSGFGTVDEKSVFIRSLPLTPVNKLAVLEELLREAGQNGSSAELISPHCYIECLDMKKIKDMSSVLQDFEKRRLQKTSHWDEDLTLPMGSMDILNFTPNVAPFSIFPFDDRTCIELIIGSKIYTSYINMGSVISSFLQSGWTVEKKMQDALDETDNLAVLMLKKDGFYCNLPPGDFARLQMELLTPEFMVAQCEYIRGLGREHEGEYSYCLCEGEAAQWI